MLGIKINTEFLELLPGTVLDMEQNNPYLQFDTEVAGEYSLPIQLPATPKNMRLTQYASLLQTRADKISIDCSVYINGFQHSIGKLRIEKPSIHLNDAKKGNISAYYLTGISSFYKDIEKLRLKDIDAGGVRNFANDNFNVNGAGFWGHIHKVLNAQPGYGVSGYDYAFFPCRNNDFQSDNLLWIVNGVSLVGGNPQFNPYFANGDYKFVNPIIPFPYLKYVMMKAVEYAGWRLTGDALDDVDFKKIVLYSQRAIKWGYPKAVGGLSPHIDWIMYPSIKFNLKNFLPDVSVAEFLLAIKNRLGLSYDFDRISKTITVRKLVGVFATALKDLTKYTAPMVVKTVLTEKKTFALRDSQDMGPFNTANTDYHGVVNRFSDLPAAAEALVGQIYLVACDNNYYVCEQNETTTVWQWNLLTSNLGGVGPDDAQQIIKTSAITAPSEKTDNYYDMIPHWDEEGARDQKDEDVDFSSIVLLFNHGIQLNVSGQKIPFGSHHVYTAAGVKVGNWSLAYKAQLFDGTQVGLYDMFFKKFLDTVTAGEEFEPPLNLPLVEFMQLKFSDVITIDNVRWYILQMKPLLPYSGQVTIKCSRVS